MTDSFDGATFDLALDGERLTTEFARVFALMRDGEWRTLEAIRERVPGSEAGISARVRDFRKQRFGGHKVERRRRSGGVFEYRLVVAPVVMEQQDLFGGVRCERPYPDRLLVAILASRWIARAASVVHALLEDAMRGNRRKSGTCPECRGPHGGFLPSRTPDLAFRRRISHFELPGGRVGEVNK